MSWQPNGAGFPTVTGKYSYWETANCLTNKKEGYDVFNALFPEHPRPDDNAEIVGYFTSWRNC